MRLTRENKHLKNQLQQKDNAIDECIKLVEEFRNSFDSDDEVFGELTVILEKLQQAKNN